MRNRYSSTHTIANAAPEVRASVAAGAAAASGGIVAPALAYGYTPQGRFEVDCPDRESAILLLKLSHTRLIARDFGCGVESRDNMARLSAKTILSTPAYPFVEAAHYLNIPLSTLRAWCLGQGYREDRKTPRFQSIIRLDANDRRALSFLNLVEAHVLAAIRRQHHVPLPKVRQALAYVSKKMDMQRPLAESEFQTDGVDLFLEKLGSLVNVTREGQTEMKDVIRDHLKRIERDTQGVPIRLFLFTRKDDIRDQPSPIVVDPRIAFGRPVLAGRSVPTAVLADRFKAGDTLTQLAEDYETSPQNIEEALRCELERKAA
jgi:uncharacterized protein (DUF433 family)